VLCSAVDEAARSYSRSPLSTGSHPDGKGLPAFGDLMNNSCADPPCLSFL
jgi:hypothetical protein